MNKLPSASSFLWIGLTMIVVVAPFTFSQKDFVGSLLMVIGCAILIIEEIRRLR